MTHSSLFSFGDKQLLKPDGDPGSIGWTRFLGKLAGELEGEWIYKGLNEKAGNEQSDKSGKEQTAKAGKDQTKITLESSFDREWSNRYCSNSEKNQWDNDTPWDDRWAHEANLLREFKRAAHHFRTHLPDKNDFLEWLSLGRHFEMPCRLVDFSYCFASVESGRTLRLG